MKRQHFGAVRCVLLASGVLLLAFATGCGGGKKKSATVAGTVKFKGAPIPSGSVGFYEKDEKGQETLVAQGGIMNGSYTVENVPLGAATITVKTLKVRGLARNPRSWTPAKPGDNPGKLAEGFKREEMEYVELPDKYGDPKKSGLEMTVAAGSNTKDLELTP